MDLARDFPDASAVAVDLVPMQSTYVPNAVQHLRFNLLTELFRTMPPNCRYERSVLSFSLMLIGLQE